MTDYDAILAAIRERPMTHREIAEQFGLKPQDQAPYYLVRAGKATRIKQALPGKVRRVWHYRAVE